MRCQNEQRSNLFSLIGTIISTRKERGDGFVVMKMDINKFVLNFILLKAKAD